MHDLTAFQRDLLVTIAELDGDGAGPKGLAIKQRIGAAYDKEINHGRLYPNLDTLFQMGLIEKGKIDERTNSYSLTKRGRRELEDRTEWLQQRVNGSEE